MSGPPPSYDDSISDQYPSKGPVIINPNIVNPITVQPNGQGPSRPRRASGLRTDMAVKLGNRLIIDFEK